MNRTGRVAAIVKILSGDPGRLYKTAYFCDLFSAAKSTISEDIKAASSALAETENGLIETISGPAGGVRFIPFITDRECRKLQEELCQKLDDPERIMGGGFLYISDIAFDPSAVSRIAKVFARMFKDSGAAFVVTIETRGIPLAFQTARYMGLPLAVVRKEPKISEGPATSINYFSASAGRMQKMSLAKKAVLPGSNALIIDDFMRAGGSIRGITELLAEFDVKTAGTGVAICMEKPEFKKIQSYRTIITLKNIDESNGSIDAVPNEDLFT